MSRFAGSYWPLRSVFLRAPAWCILFCFVLLMFAPKIYSSEQSELIENLQMRLLNIGAQAANLEAELQTLKQLSSESERRANALLIELDALKSEFQNWQNNSTELQNQVIALKESQILSEEKLKALLLISQHSADSWKAALDASILRERKARARGIIWIALAALAGGLTGYLLGK